MPWKIPTTNRFGLISRYVCKHGCIDSSTIHEQCKLNCNDSTSHREQEKDTGKKTKEQIKNFFEELLSEARVCSYQDKLQKLVKLNIYFNDAN